MSFHYEVVVSCFLEARTPDTVLSTLFWLLGISDERPRHLDDDTFPYQMFDPDPDSRLPGGDLAVLRQQKRGLPTFGEVTEWGLHVRVLVPDEGLGEIYEFLELIEPHVAGDGYAGHIRAEHDTTQIELLFLDGATARSGGGPGTFVGGVVQPDGWPANFDTAADWAGGELKNLDGGGGRPGNFEGGTGRSDGGLGRSEGGAGQFEGGQFEGGPFEGGPRQFGQPGPVG